MLHSLFLLYLIEKNPLKKLPKNHKIMADKRKNTTKSDQTRPKHDQNTRPRPRQRPIRPIWEKSNVVFGRMSPKKHDRPRPGRPLGRGRCRP